MEHASLPAPQDCGPAGRVVFRDHRKASSLAGHSFPVKSLPFAASSSGSHQRIDSRPPFGYLAVMSDLVSSAKMDKTVFSVAPLGQESDDRAYWLSKTIDERIEALELLRQIHYGYDPTTQRLQRVLAVIELGEG